MDCGRRPERERRQDERLTPGLLVARRQPVELDQRERLQTGMALHGRFTHRAVTDVGPVVPPAQVTLYTAFCAILTANVHVLISARKHIIPDFENCADNARTEFYVVRGCAGPDALSSGNLFWSIYVHDTYIRHRAAPESSRLAALRQLACPFSRICKCCV